MGIVSKYGNLYDVKKNIIFHAPVTSSHFRSILKNGNELQMMTCVTTPKLFGIHASKKFKHGRWRRVLTHFNSYNNESKIRFLVRNQD